MSDLMAWLTACVDDDEAAAAQAGHGGDEWEQADARRFPGRIESARRVITYDEGSPDEREAAHIVRHDPARVLREVAAKREMIALCATETDETGGRPLAIRILRLLASGYEDEASARPDA